MVKQVKQFSTSICLDDSELARKIRRLHSKDRMNDILMTRDADHQLDYLPRDSEKYKAVSNLLTSIIEEDTDNKRLIKTLRDYGAFEVQMGLIREFHLVL